MKSQLGAGAIVLVAAASSADALDVNDQFSIVGIIAAAGQCQEVSALLPPEDYGRSIDDTDSAAYSSDLDQFGNECRGGLPVHIELDYHPTDNDQFFFALGWAVGNGLNEVSPFRLAPWAADLEDNVEDINGSSRDYLLQAWYRHRFDLQGGNSIAGTFGIIDSTAYLDTNEYANDKLNQFMNEAFVNAGNYSLPSYEAGVALEARFGSVSINAVGMNIYENDEGNNYNFWGVQIGWHPELEIGAGNYRVNISGTSSKFAAPYTVVESDPETTLDEHLVLVDDQELVEVPGDEQALLGWGLSRETLTTAASRSKLLPRQTLVPTLPDMSRSNSVCRPLRTWAGATAPGRAAAQTPWRRTRMRAVRCRTRRRWRRCIRRRSFGQNRSARSRRWSPGCRSASRRTGGCRHRSRRLPCRRRRPARRPGNGRGRSRHQPDCGSHKNASLWVSSRCQLCWQTT